MCSESPAGIYLLTSMASICYSCDHAAWHVTIAAAAKCYQYGDEHIKGGVALYTARATSIPGSYNAEVGGAPASSSRGRHATGN